MLSFAYKRFERRVPEPGALDDEDRALLAKVESGFETVGDLYNACKFRSAPSFPQDRPGQCAGPGPGGQRLPGPQARSCEATAKLTLRVSPGSQIKEDKAAAATSVYVILRAVDNLKTILAPILPHTPVLTHRTQKLHEYLGYGGQLFGTQHVVEYQEGARHGGLRSHQALTYDHSGAIGTWAKSDLLAGQALRQPTPLFKKLDESEIEEYARLDG